MSNPTTNVNQTIHQNPTRNIKGYYYIALFILIILTFFSTFIIICAVREMKLHDYLVNTSGRQRMRSQMISKNILILTHPNIKDYPEESRKKAVVELVKVLDVFQTTHEHLTNCPNDSLNITNSKEITSLYREIDPHYEDIVKYTQRIISMTENGLLHPELLKENASNNVEHISLFVTLMNKVVDQYTKEAEEGQQNALFEIYGVAALFLICFAILSFFIFNPALDKINTSFLLLEEKNKSIKANEEEISQNLEELCTTQKHLEKSLAEVEDLYENAPAGYHSLNEDGLFIKINKTALDWLGYTREEVVGKMKFSDVADDDGKELFETTFKRLLEVGFVRDIPYTIVAKNGNKIPVFLNSTAMKDENGAFIATRSMMFDRSEIVKTQQLLTKNQNLLFETEIIAKVGGWELNLDTNQINCTKGVYQIYELEDMDFLLEMGNFLSFFPSEMKKVIQNSYEKLRKEGISFDLQTPFTNAKGKQLWIKIIGKSKKTGSKITGIFGSIQDITDEIIAQQKIQKNEILLDAIINNTTSIIYIKDLEGRYLKVNNQFNKVLNPGNDSVLGKTDYDYQKKESADALRKADALVAQQQKLMEFEETVLQDSGETHTYISVKFPLFDEKRNIYAVAGISTDITERKKTENQVRIKNEELETLSEELRQQVEEIDATNEELMNANHKFAAQTEELEKVNHVKDKLFAIISHDLRSPLNLFRGIIQLLNMGAISEDEKKNLMTELERNTNSTLATLDNLLSWSMAQIEGKEMDFSEVVLEDVVKEVFGFLDSAAVHKHIQLKNDIDSTRIVYADEEMVKLIFRNLIANSIKFTPENGLVSLSAIEVENEMLEICITDTGVGMNPEAAENLFNQDKFFSTKGTSNEKGTGLGLMLCKDFVEKNGGRIWVESKVDNGTKFFFTLHTKAF